MNFAPGKIPLRSNSRRKCIYTVSQKGDHPTTIDNFNNSFPIPVILVQILQSKYAIERWFDMPPHLFIVRPLPSETLRPRKITSSAVKERLFELLVFYLSITFVSHMRSQ